MKEGAYALFFAGALSFGAPLFAADGDGLKVMAAIDIVGEVAAAPSSQAQDQVWVREAEVMFTAPIDHLFVGTLSLAAHPEAGATIFELHEGFVASSTLIPRSRFRLGQFLLGVGRLNQVHRHDWPFISAPQVHRNFFDAEAAIDSGFEFSTLLPLPAYLDLTLGVTNGRVYGHSHTAGEKPKVPTHYVRLATFAVNTQIGLNYLGRTNNAGTKMQLLGFDVVTKIRTGKVIKLLLQSEVWQRQYTVQTSGDQENTIGAYIFPQYGWTNGLSFGLRADYYSVTTLKDAAGSPVANMQTALVPTLTYKPSEFSTWRLAYTTSSGQRAGSNDENNNKIEGQATYVIGAHPAHEF